MDVLTHGEHSPIAGLNICVIIAQRQLMAAPQYSAQKRCYLATLT